MADQSLYPHEVEVQIIHLNQQIQVEKDSCKLVALVEELNRLLEARENTLARLRLSKSA